MLIPIEAIREAAARIGPRLHRTPMLTSRTLGEASGVSLGLKCESLQKTGSFKPRGALNIILSLPGEQRAKGLVTVSAGNHAAAVAWAAGQAGVPCTVVMPRDAPRSKMEAVRAYGATIVAHDDRATLFDRLREEETRTGAFFVHPFDDPIGLAGAGTVGLEILEQMPEADCVVVPIGGGGLMAGVACAIKALRPKCRVVGVELAAGPGMTPALAAGKPVPAPRPRTLADGLTPPFVGERPLQVARECVDEIALVTEDEIMHAMRMLLVRAKLVVEGAGAAATAALLAGKVKSATAGSRVVSIVSGGNVDPERLLSLFVSGSPGEIRVKVLFVNEPGVHELLPMRECVDLMRQALIAFSNGDAVLPLRSMVWLPDKTGLLGLMPGYLGEPRSFGLKVVSVMPGNHGTGYDSHQGVVMLFGLEHGEPLAILDATAITAIRTAAASGLATQVLAREDAGDLALIGSGTQARAHLQAMACVRRLRRVRVHSRSQATAERFARENASASPVPIEVMASAEAAVRGADLICTTTSSREPVLLGRWLPPGAHINAVGACFPASRELDTEAVRQARLYTDCRESCENEAGDYRLPLAEGAITAAHLLGELGDVLTGKVPGRLTHDDVTLYESLGIALEDLASAHFIHARAKASGAGTWLEWGGPADGH